MLQILLNLLGFEVPDLATLDAEALVEKRSIHPLNEAVGPRASDLGRGSTRDLVFEEETNEVCFRCRWSYY